MNKDDFYYLGKILKPYGNKGHLLVLLDVDDLKSYQNLGSVFIGIQNDRIPFFIDHVELKGNKKAVLHFEDVNSSDDAEPFAGKPVYLPLSTLPKLKGNRFYYHEVIGFRVIDEIHGSIGTVASILDISPQALIQVMKDQKEILVPLVDELLLKVDRKRKELHIRLPEGLLEIYL